MLCGSKTRLTLTLPVMKSLGQDLVLAAAVNHRRPNPEHQVDTKRRLRLETSKDPRTYFPAEALPGVGKRLGRHEGGRAGRAGQQGVIALKLVADPEVCDLHVTIVAQQQIGGFDVSVDNFLVVHCEDKQTTDQRTCPLRSRDRLQRKWVFWMTQHQHLTVNLPIPNVLAFKVISRIERCFFILWFRIFH